MAAIPGPSPQPRQPDDTYDNAELALIADIRRLGHTHVIEGWGMLGNGTRYLVCSCTQTTRTDEAFWQHILKALAKERGPLNNRKRK